MLARVDSDKRQTLSASALADDDIVPLGAILSQLPPAVLRARLDSRLLQALTLRVVFALNMIYNVFEKIFIPIMSQGNTYVSRKW